MLSAALSGCFQTFKKWEREGTSIQKWSIDKIECKSKSKNLAKKELQLKSYNQSRERNSHLTGFYAQMRAFDRIKNQNILFQDCLKRLGYRPIK